MMIERGQEIGGVSAVTARDLMRKIGERAVTPGFVADVLDDGRSGLQILEAFESLGFVCRVDRASARTVFFGSSDAPGARGDHVWATTVAGNALAKARIGKPIPRKKAQALLDGLIARAAALNADVTSTFVVEEISVFGSFAEGRDEVGDVDVSLIFDRRVDADRFAEMSEEAAVEAELDGKSFRSMLERLTVLDAQFQRELKAGSDRLDIQFDPAGHVPLLPDGVRLISVYRREP